MKAPLFVMEPQWEWLTRTVYDPSVTWVAITATLTLVLAICALIPLWSVARTKKTELAWRLRDDFWTARVKAILFLVNHGMLRYMSGNPPYFTFAAISSDPARPLIQEALGDRVEISSFEIDDELLNPLNEAAALAFEHSISFEDVYALFGNFIKSISQNEEVQKHIAHIRTLDKRHDSWSYLEHIVPTLDRLDAKFLKRAKVK